MISLKSKKKKIVIQILLFLMVAVYVLPLLQMFLGSLGGRGFYNYVAVWETGVVPYYFRNSIIISGSVILLVYVFSMTAGFGFAKLKIPAKEIFFWLILVALTLPEVILLTLINSWNSYLLPLLFLQSPSMQTVTLLPQYFQGEFTNDQTKILAAAVMTALPEIPAYLRMQKNFERGMSAGH